MIPIIGSEFPKIVIPLLKEAKHSIDLVVFDWRWYPDQITHPVQQFNIALVNAVNRGVNVRAIVHHTMLIPILNKIGIQARRVKDRRMVHAKMILIDRQKLIIGSHNFTRNAFTHNIETSVVVDVPPEITRFSEFFENLFII